MRYSENLHLNLPEDTDPLEVSKLSENFETLDGASKESGYQVGDILATYRTDLGDNWLLCNGDAFDPEEYPKLAALCDFPADTAFQKRLRYTFFDSVSEEAKSGSISRGYCAVAGRTKIITGYTLRGSSSSTYYFVWFDRLTGKMNKYSMQSGSGEYGFAASNVQYIDGANLMIGLANGSSYYTVDESADTVSVVTRTKPGTYWNSCPYAIKYGNNILSIGFVQSNNVITAFSFTTFGLDGSPVGSEAFPAINYTPAGWSAISTGGTAAQDGKFIAFVVNSVYNRKTTSAAVGIKYQAAAIMQIDPSNKSAPVKTKFVNIYFESAMSFYIDAIDNKNSFVRTLPSGEVLVSVRIHLSGSVEWTNRTVVIKSFDDLPDDIDIHIDEPPFAGIDFSNYNNKFIAKYKDMYIYSSKVTSEGNGNLVTISATKDFIDTISFYGLAPYDGMSVSNTVLAPQNPPEIIEDVGGKQLLAVLFHLYVSTGNGSTGCFANVEIPFFSLPNISGDTYSYIKAKEAPSNANQQADAPPA